MAKKRWVYEDNEKLLMKCPHDLRGRNEEIRNNKMKSPLTHQAAR